MRRLVVALCLVAFAPLPGCAPAVRYERSPQWRDGRFANPKSWPPFPGIGDFFSWRLGPRPERGRARPRMVHNGGARLRENRDAVSVTWIGHATMLVQAGGLSILTDPVFSRWVGVFERTTPPGVAIADLPRIDVVVISHNHYDHLDADSVRALGKEVTYVVPLGLARWFEGLGLSRVRELDWWEQTVFEEPSGRAEITLVPAQHWSRRGLTDRNRSLWGGYVIDAGDRRFYFAGDTGFPAAFTEIGRRFPGIHYAILPIGAYAPRWFMHPQHIDPEEAVRAFRRLGAGRLVPMHWGTFPLADEPTLEPPILLRRAMGNDAGRILQLPIGGTHWEGGSSP